MLEPPRLSRACLHLLHYENFLHQNLSKAVTTYFYVNIDVGFVNLGSVSDKTKAADDSL